MTDFAKVSQFLDAENLQCGLSYLCGTYRNLFHG
jgi:hypothetical protein